MQELNKWYHKQVIVFILICKMFIGVRWQNKLTKYRAHSTINVNTISTIVFRPKSGRLSSLELTKTPDNNTVQITPSH